MSNWEKLATRLSVNEMFAVRNNILHFRFHQMLIEDSSFYA